MANFTKELPRWEANGIQPPDNLLTDGWKASQRPPADYFNWFFSRTHFALKELQELAAKDSDLVAHERSKNNPHEVTATQVGLGNLINQKQATKVEFDTHNEDAVRHILKTERDNWNSKAAGVHTHQWADILGVPISGLSQKGIVQLLDSVASTDKTMAATPNSVKLAHDRGSTGIVDAAAAKKITEDHIANKANPHGTTKSHVGLGSVQDFSIASTTEAQTGSLNNRYMTPFLVNEAIKSLQAVKSVNGRIGDVVISKTDVGLGNVDNIQQATKVEFNAHSTNRANPHGVTAGQAGAYTKAETDSKVSSAQNAVQTNLNTHVNNKANPHATTKAHVGLGNVDNVQQATKAEFNAHNGDGTRHMTSAERTYWNGKLNANANAVSATKLLTVRSIDGVLFDGTANISTPVATPTVAGKMSAADKVKLDNIEKMKPEIIFEGRVGFKGGVQLTKKISDFKFLTVSASFGGNSQTTEFSSTATSWRLSGTNLTNNDTSSYFDITEMNASKSAEDKFIIDFSKLVSNNGTVVIGVDSGAFITRVVGWR